MVLESIINPKKAERHPWELFFIGLVYSSAAFFLSLWIFKGSSSLVHVFLTTLACIPLFYNTLKLEEKKDMNINQEKTLLKEHTKALEFFMFLFLGFVVSLSIWYAVLPEHIIADAFSVQTGTIQQMSGRLSGHVTSNFNNFMSTLFNNLIVLILCIIFSFVYGVGAIFILVWNASVIATAVGNIIRTGIEKIATTVGSVTMINYFHVVSFAFARYILHGIPEILAYFVAGLAGGIISIAVIRHDYRSVKFQQVLLDALDLTMISIGLVIVAAFLEVYVSWRFIG